MISDAMERILQELYADARARSFELITLEQLLLALMEQSDDVQQVLEALHVDLDVLSGQLVSSIQDNTPTLPPNLMDKVETQPTLGFQRVMQRAIVHAVGGKTRSAAGGRAGGADERERLSGRLFPPTAIRQPRRNPALSGAWRRGRRRRGEAV